MRGRGRPQRRHGVPTHRERPRHRGADVPRRRDASTTARTASTPPTSCATSTTARHAARLGSGRLLREWELIAADKEIEVAPGVKFPAWTYNGRVPGPTLRCREGDLLADPVRQRLGASAHGALPRAPSLGHGRRPRRRAPGSSSRASRPIYEFDAEPFGLHLYHCHVAPLAEHIARGMYGTFIVDPEAGPPRRGRDGDGPERLQHDLRRRGQPALRGQRDPVPLHGTSRSRSQRDELVRIYLVNVARVRPDQLVPRPRELLQLLPDRHVGSTPTEFTDTVIQGQAQRGHLRADVPARRPVHVPRPQDRVRRARLDGLLRGGLMEAGRNRGRRGSPLDGVPAWALAGGVIALIARRPGDARGRRRRQRCPTALGPPIEELAVEQHRLEPNQIELTLRNTGPDEVEVAQVFVERRLRRLRRRRGADRQARVGHDHVDFPGRKASRTWSRSSPRPALVIEHEIAAAVETPDDRRRPVRADGAARPLRRRHPRDAGDAPAAGDAPLPAGPGSASSWP